jgi:hypothetical protein
MATATKRPEPVQRKEVPGAPRQIKDSRRVEVDPRPVVFDDWAML